MELAKRIRIECIYSPVVNYAMVDNRVPFLKKLILTNSTEEDMENLVLSMEFQNPFASFEKKTIAFLPKGARIDMGVVEVIQDSGFHLSLTEKIQSAFTVVLKKDDTVVEQETFEVSVLPMNQWTGVSVMPELLASFVTPNHPGIDRILLRAFEILGEHGKDPSFEGYQSQDPNRLLEQASAIFTALKEQEITYTGPPASFEVSGQRIRLAAAVLEQKLATCLDLTVLYAACLEAISLNTMVVITEGHAFLGLWLQEEFFPETVQDDVTSLTKRIAKGVSQIALIETTSLRAGSLEDFNGALQSGERNLQNGKRFIMAVDIARARAGGIKPLPQVVEQNGVLTIREEKPLKERALVMPELLNIVKLDVEETKAVHSRQLQWERKLLDLGLRNNLLNYREGKTAIPLITPSLSLLEDAIATGTEFQILPRPEEVRSEDGAPEARPVASDSSFTESEFRQKRLRSMLTEDDLQGRIVKLFRTARTAIEESGANSLFLVLGQLKWYESTISQKARYAPLVLVPVDLVRKIARKGYVIKAREEDAVFNITLAEMLKQDFKIEIPGIDPLPEDENGIDLTRVMSIVRTAIINEKRWDVLEESHIGIFSFRKFIMWNDIKNHGDDLAKNKIIKSLMEGSLQFVPESIEEETVLLDDVYSPQELLLPISADASQMMAVEAAGEGKSFVLHGPPGTGKSQTITNIIANALAQGKRVLFVAEKMAALSVVQRRLQKIGLGPFSLEIHSNKAKKRDVLQQMDNTIRMVKGRSSEDFMKTVKKLEEERKALNGIVKAMYRPYSFGYHAYGLVTALGELEKEKEIPMTVELDFGTLSGEALEKVIQIAKDLESCVREVGDYRDTPLKGIGLASYSPTAKRQAEEGIRNLQESLTLNEPHLRNVQEIFGLQDMESKESTTSLYRVLHLVMAEDDVTLRLLSSGSISVLTGRIREAGKFLSYALSLRDSVLEEFDPSVMTMDEELLIHELNEASVKWFVQKLIVENRVLKLVKAKEKGDLVTKENLKEHLVLLKSTRSAESAAVQSLKGIPELGTLDQGMGTDPDRLKEIADTLDRIAEEIHKLMEEKEAAEGLMKQLGPALQESSTRNQLEDAEKAYNTFSSLYTELESMLNLDLSVIPELEGTWFERLSERLKTYGNNLDYLRDWTIYNRVKEEAKAHRIYPLIEAFEGSEILGREAVGGLKKTLYRSALEYIMSREPVLMNCTGRLIEDRVAIYREACERYEVLAQEEIFNILASKVPNMTEEVSQSSEVGILQRAIRSNGRSLSIRKLLDSIPNLLPRIAPCMLMSPISVAQYLSTGKALFDIVVFDEASQMPTAEAVGAMARGKEVVIVGDPKQLPPTSFFNSTNTDEEELETEDLDNILEDCLALSIPQSYLQWHYRSRHESLIAFSNKNYYENRLYTYPSPDDQVSKVTYHYVEGVYERGKSKHNRNEAKAVVDEVMRRLLDEELSKRSIGVVTFSQVQQNLIEDLLAEALLAHPEIEERIMNMEEPVFVKNLENVQGDERDVILFSIGYGPDENGKLTLNFGPLNREGGWRRLNVAVSRARYEMAVFTNIRPEMIDPSRTTAQGVADLKSFLEYARSGKQALPLSDAERRRDLEGLDRVIASKLEERGYKVHTDIGNSNFKVDIGIVNPDKPTEYILGIGCGGASYQEARTARDRDILQDSVMAGLGWNLHRIYPMDWYENMEKELDRVAARVDAILSGDDRLKAAGEDGTNAIRRTEPVLRAYPAETSQAESPSTAGLEYDFTPIEQRSFSSEEFQMPKNRRKIKDDLVAIIENEAPISTDYLFRRILTAYGVRSGIKTRAIIDNLLTDLGYTITGDGVLFVWNDRTTPETVTQYRYSRKEDSREFQDIPEEELLAAVREVIRKNVSLPETDLVREVA
ncbi:MAG TPA: DUF3320 domain-containing protein, partial [Clostridiaceae bacterium]|nr:DUF3320 domain-containing protein [Clostridiaceae bacterium]